MITVKIFLEVIENLEKVLITYLLSELFFIYIYKLYLIITNIMLELINE